MTHIEKLKYSILTKSVVKLVAGVSSMLNSSITKMKLFICKSVSSLKSCRISFDSKFFILFDKGHEMMFNSIFHHNITKIYLQ